MSSHHCRSVSALSFESCGSSSGSSSSIGRDSSAMMTCDSRRASTLSSADLLGFCFCGQPTQTLNGDDDDDLTIYCSSQCARKDALHALLGGGGNGNDDEAASDACETRHSSMQAVHHHEPTQRSPRLHGQHVLTTAASLALQKVTKMDELTHYRRMGAIHARRDSYPLEVLEDVYLTPLSARSVAAGDVDEDDAQSSATLTVDGDRHSISLPPTPTLQRCDIDTDDDDDYDDASAQRRNRHNEIEAELRELDALLAEQLQAFSLPNGEPSSGSSKELDEEEDVLMSISSPLLDYEAPLGWRNSTRIYSSNFLGLHLGRDDNDGQQSPSARSDDSDRAMCEHVASHLGWQWSAMEDKHHVDDDKKAEPAVYIPTALELARELAYVQAAHKPASANASPSVRFTNPFASSVSTIDRLAEPLPPPPPRQRSNTLRTLPSKRNLYHFFSRRPSEPTFSSASKGVSSADLALTPHLAPRSVPPRFSSLTSSVPMRRPR